MCTIPIFRSEIHLRMQDGRTRNSAATSSTVNNLLSIITLLIEEHGEA
jgi:hypothetical protein